MAVLSLGLFIVTILIGNGFPRKSAFLMLIIWPLFYPANLVIVPSDLLLLNIDRICFAIALGINLKYKNILKPIFSLKDRFIKNYILFSIIIVFISLNYNLVPIIFTYIPRIYIAFILGSVIIKKPKDYYILIRILSWQSAFLSIVVLLQFFNIYDLAKEIRLLLPGYELHTTYQQGELRASILRVPGMDGNSVQSSYRLAFLLLVSLYYMLKSTSTIRFVPYTLTLIAIVLMMSRAAYIAVIISFIYLIVILTIKLNYTLYNRLKYIISLFFIIISLFFVVLFIFPTSIRTVNTFIEYNFSANSEKQVTRKVERLPIAFSYFKEKPIIGYGSPYYVYYELMESQDLPSLFIYALSGGVFLLLLYLYMLYLMVVNLFRYFSNSLDNSHKELFIFISASFVGGLLPLFSNLQERHFPIMLLVYISSLKYIYITFKASYIKKYKHK